MTAGWTWEQWHWEGREAFWEVSSVELGDFYPQNPLRRILGNRMNLCISVKIRIIP